MAAEGKAPVGVVLDASVWVSSELLTDSNHFVASAWINRHLEAHGYFVEPVWLLAEVAAAISRQAGPQHANNTIALLARLYRQQTMRFLPMSPALMNDTVAIARDYGIRAGDAVYVALARQLAIPLVSFDRDHLTRVNSIITVIKP
ncbi:MAG: type II toxin-antitoxin system VapC family toxin [Chloroflexota bacterium]|nr:type II toxin-antitoxin system VapC family toxin [Chloroflexota bacterium]